MSKVILQGYIIVPISDLDAVKQAPVTHTTLTQKEPGRLRFRVLPDDNNPNKFNVYEEFTNQTAIEQHQFRIRQPH